MVLVTGAGKAFLASKVVHITRAQFDNASNQGFAFFYRIKYETERQKPLSVLGSYSEKPVKFFLSRRRDGDIQTAFQNLPNVEIQAKHNERDIHAFISKEIIKHENWGEMPNSLQEEIKQALSRSSDGIFQWANLQVKQLLELTAMDAIRDRLGKLPKNLRVTYNEIYGKIRNGHPHDKELAARAFEWRKVWKFSHLSLVEHLEEKHFSLKQAHPYAAEVCLQYLIETYKEDVSHIPQQSDEESDGESDKRSNQSTTTLSFPHRLENYSSGCWVYPAYTQIKSKGDHELSHLLKTFLGSPKERSVQYRSWHTDSPGYVDIWINGFGLDAAFKPGIYPAKFHVLTMCRFSSYALVE
ncbi:hypothetical protein TSTA_045980 [Talaromyces stipitatus ATCC 10500]|uniref:Uncharacterized protein n=1 Tax=Talaromyces stipitatus (strain ATCC 10500 / CBS 375.48 / QM 6759 / NRRL 1006) TaxID=441959 RepID=B8MJE3_TALSN|nr:uncharacterized protein TSTA_045980 [Talaromyces stipitatus ATCC 10500]EED15143.1 hypothetical protein TSTA_045980 [Talaromyces stipitatus ATCC 10500]